MFQPKNTNTESASINSYLSPEAPIHLMKNDLEELKNPKKESSKVTPVNKSAAPEKEKPAGPNISNLNLSEKQKTSPFFSFEKKQEIQTPKIQENLKTPEPPKPILPAQPEKPIQEIKKEAPLPQSRPKNEFPPKIETSVFSQKQLKAAAKSVDGFNLNKIILTFVIIFIIIAFGAGGYYFWIIKNNTINQNQSQKQTEEQSEIVSETITPTETPVSIEFSAEKLNSFPIDVETATKDSLAQQLDAYLEKAKEMNITSPIEFIVTDKQNNPVGFKIFAEKMSLNFSAATMAALKNTFSLFIYNDNENYRLGLLIDSANNAALKIALAKEESDLSNILTPIFRNPDNKEIVPEKIFSLNNYKKVEIRYNNIISPEYLSIDYAIFKNQLIFATTKATAWAIIDYITANNAPKNGAANIQKKAIPENIEKPTEPMTGNSSQKPLPPQQISE